MIDRLSQVKELEVIARTSVMTYKKKEKKAAEIGRELKAGTLVEGSVRKSGNKIRVTIQLIDATTEGHLWSSRYDRNLEDIFVVQTDIAEKVADALKVQLLPNEVKAIAKHSTSNSDAYLLYLKGRHYWNERSKDSLIKAIRQFELAIEKDSTFALAYVGLSDSYTVLADYEYVPPADSLPKAKEYATKALKLDETLPEAHASLAIVLYELWELDAAEREFKRAIDLNPSYASAHQWYGEFLWSTKRDSEHMIAEKLKARELDPLSPAANVNVGVGYYATRQYDRAVDEFRKTVESFPDSFGARLWLAAGFLAKGRFEEALTEIDKAALPGADEIRLKMNRAVALALWGKTDEAMALIEEMKALSKVRFVSPIELAVVHAAVGQTDEAFRWLNKGCDEQYYSQIDSVFYRTIFSDRLGADPRWGEVLRKLKLTS